jgi:hypothetical protein
MWFKFGHALLKIEGNRCVVHRVERGDGSLNLRMVTQPDRGRARMLRWPWCERERDWISWLSLSSKLGTCKTVEVKARFWFWLSDLRTENLSSCSLFARKQYPSLTPPPAKSKPDLYLKVLVNLLGEDRPHPHPRTETRDPRLETRDPKFETRDLRPKARDPRPI